MKSKEQEYEEIFVAEALEYYDALSRDISMLEKTPDDDQLLAEIFRYLHNLKANAKAIGFIDISDLSHKLETVFGLIRNKELIFQDDLITLLFEGIDTLGELIKNINNPKVKHADEKLLRNLEVVIKTVDSSNLDVSKVPKDINSKNLTLSDLIYIPIKKLDHMLNLVGELIIDRDRILSLSKEIGNNELTAVSAHLFRITEELQFSVMDARLVSIGTLFNKFPRIVRDIALAEKKQIDFEISGQEIQIDRNILQVITDSLLHLMRNAITHGIETASDRKKLGKDEEGHIWLSARNDRDMVQVELRDDGKGIDLNEVKKRIVSQGYMEEDAIVDLRDSEVLSYIFEPGFSLAKEVTEFSGRGVGLDVVKNAIDFIGGRVNVASEPGIGTTFTLHIPTSIAVKGSLLFDVKGGYFAIPLIHTDSVVALENDKLHEVGEVLMADIKNETTSLVCMNQLLNAPDNSVVKGDKNELTGDIQNIIIVQYNNRKLGLIVDKLLRQQDIVIKPLNKPVENIDIYSGVTLLGSGKVCLVLDVPAIIRHFLLKR